MVTLAFLLGVGKKVEVKSIRRYELQNVREQGLGSLTSL